MLTNNSTETQALAKEVLRKLEDCNLILLKGPLGAGKTTLVQAIGKELGISRITSPTFTIIRSYELPKNFGDFTHFHHVDLYRLQEAAETEGLGLQELINEKENLVVIEWPEIIENTLTQKHLTIVFEIIDEQTREITII